MWAGYGLTRDRLHLAVVAAGIAAGLLQVLGAMVGPPPYARTTLYLFIYSPIELLVGWSFLFVGLVAARRRPHNAVGLLMSLFGLTWFISALIWIPSPVPFWLGVGFRTAYLAVLAHLVVVYPRGRPTGRLEWTVIAVIYAFYAFTVVRILAVSGNCANANCPANPFYISASAGLAPVAGEIARYGTIAAALIVLAVFARRWMGAGPPLRRAMSPAAWAALPVLAVVVLDQLGPLPSDLATYIAPVEWLAFAILPLGLLIGLLRTRLGRAAVGDLVIELGRLPVPGTVRNLLARALGDPSLELALAVPEGGYVDSAGRRVTLPPPTSGRAVTTIESNGAPLAALIHDPAVDDEDPGLVVAAGSAARLALENERLQAAVRASLDEVRASRARILDAADAERRRLERDIHDGAQQRLVTLGAHLKLARDHAQARGDTDLVIELEDAGMQVKQAVDELRQLAQGIHPAVLSRGGIRSALRALAELSPISVEVRNAPSERYPERVEAAAYFVISEALANAAKHSGANLVEVSVGRDGDHLCIDVVDDGVGGADPTRGSGLIGIADRASVLGGRVEVHSLMGAGTTVHCEIPCA